MLGHISRFAAINFLHPLCVFQFTIASLLSEFFQVEILHYLTKEMSKIQNRLQLKGALYYTTLTECHCGRNFKLKQGWYSVSELIALGGKKIYNTILNAI